MNEYFLSPREGDSLRITDDGLFVVREGKTLNYNYGSIQSVKIGALGTFTIWGTDKTVVSHPLKFKEDKKRIKLLLPAIEERIRNAKKAQIVEYRKKCNVCGKVFCYTDEDIEKNNKLKDQVYQDRKLAALSAIGGSALDTHDARIAADRKEARIVDFERCPNCNSANLTMLTDEEYQQIVSANKASSQTSAADEIKKFKELLDSSIITQEEFDAKKKQLLGL